MKSKLFHLIAVCLMGMSLSMIGSDHWSSVDLGENKSKKKGLLQVRDPYNAIRPRLFSRTALEKLKQLACCCHCKKKKQPLTISEYAEL